ncbi:MAG: peptidoglycan-binding protein [Pseudomonadota bacterium]
MPSFQLPNGKRVDIKRLVRELPGAWVGWQNKNRANWVAALSKSWRVLDHYGINTPNRLGFFFAQGLVETSYLRASVERLNYSLKNYDETGWFQNRFDSREQFEHEYLGSEERIANRIYSSRYVSDLGNGDEASGDGWRFRGRGFFQLTGRYNYGRYNGLIPGVDLVQNPDVLGDDLLLSIKVAAAYWADRELNAYADQDDAVAISRAVNLGNPNSRKKPNHLADRKKWSFECVRFFGETSTQVTAPRDPSREVHSSEESDDVREIQQDLKALGYLDGTVDGVFGPDTLDALRRFERDNDLPEDGVASAEDRQLLAEQAQRLETSALQRERNEKPERSMADQGLHQAVDGKSLGQAGTSVAGTGAVAAGVEAIDDLAAPVAELQEVVSDEETMGFLQRVWSALDPRDPGNWTLLLLLILVAVGGYIYWRSRRVERESVDAYRSGRLR